MTSSDPAPGPEDELLGDGEPWDDSQWHDFGDWLAAQRIRLGLTKRQAAARAELSPSTWSTLEMGGRTYRGEWTWPSPEDTTLVRIAKAVEIDPWEVFEMLKRPWRDDLDPTAAGYRPNQDDPYLTHSATHRYDPPPGPAISASGADLEALRREDPEMYDQLVQLARTYLARSRASRGR